jgi:flagellar hook-associated protein 3 FlgL
MLTRVTGNVFADRLIDQMQMLQQRENGYQLDLATGKRIHKPADDPAGYRQTLELQSDQRRVQQYRSTTNGAITQTQATYSAATELQTIVSRASELAIRASNGALAQSDRNVVASEIDSLLERAVTLGNRQQSNQFLFGGNGLQPTDVVGGNSYVPFAVTRNAAGRITAVTWSAANAVVPRKVEVDVGSTVECGVLGGRAAAGASTSRALFIDRQITTVPAGGVDVFATLVKLRDDLTNNTYNPTTTMTDLHNIEDNVAVVVGATAASLSQYQAKVNTHTQKLQSDENTLSQVSDTEMTDTVVSLTQTQNAFQAALQTGAKVLNISLLDYL